MNVTMLLTPQQEIHRTIRAASAEHDKEAQKESIWDKEGESGVAVGVRTCLIGGVRPTSGQSATHRWTASGRSDRRAAVTRCSSAPSIILEKLGLSHRTLHTICSCPWLLGCTGSEGGSKGRSCGRAICLQVESLLSNRHRKYDLWIGALWRLQWKDGRREWACQL